MCTKPYVKTPVGEVTVGDVVCYYRTNKVVKFGTVEVLLPKKYIGINHCFAVHINNECKQIVYQLLRDTIHTSEVKDIL